ASATTSRNICMLSASRRSKCVRRVASSCPVAVVMGPASFLQDKVTLDINVRDANTPPIWEVFSVVLTRTDENELLTALYGGVLGEEPWRLFLLRLLARAEADVAQLMLRPVGGEAW